MDNKPSNAIPPAKAEAIIAQLAWAIGLTTHALHDLVLDPEAKELRPLAATLLLDLATKFPALSEKMDVRALLAIAGEER